ncbi:MAG: hypothetical protein IJG07_06725 [Prevotella sp.]|nr:hypothetical protein [Prevotella sp.]MBQ6549701.1 hypothetical protein [Prevotella sp.]
MQEQFDIDKVKVHRTLEGSIFEIATLVILQVAYAIAFSTKFFDLSNMMGKHVAIIIISVVSVMLLFAAYAPKHINLGQELKNIRQVEIAIRTVRIMAVELALFCLLMVAVSPDNPIIHTALCVMVVVTALNSSILIRKAK